MGSMLRPGENDLLSRRPDLAAQWHPTKNGNLRPQDVCVFSGMMAWWMVKEIRFGREFTLEWKATVANRAGGTGCPYTSVPPRKLLKGFNDLQSTNPDLAKKWHPSKNGEIKPDMVFENTNRRYWWSHEVWWDGRRILHEWLASPTSVKQRGAEKGCPICHGTQVLAGYNDLATRYPEVAQEWNFEKNALSPTQITYGSNRSVYWKCRHCGHEWKASVHNRTGGGSQCPQCARRSQTSFSEQAIYFYLKQRFASCINRDRTVLPKGELDIFLPEEKFAIEYCGLRSHKSSAKRVWDEAKREMCREKGILLVQVYEDRDLDSYFPQEHRILCVPRSDYRHLDHVMLYISKELIAAGRMEKAISVDIGRDERSIREMYQQSAVKNSLAEQYPEIAKEWDYGENGMLRPEGFSSGSNARVGWCHEAWKDGRKYIHRWKASIAERTGSGRGCPVCAGKKVLGGYNDLKSCSPIFLEEWDYSRNMIAPDQVTPYSGKKVWWWHEVEKNGIKTVHTWQASPCGRMRGRGCAVCAGKRIQQGSNDLAATHPELISEWDYERNSIAPEMVSYGYDKDVWWRHTVVRNGVEYIHSWRASPNSRTNCRSGCPYCANKKALKGYNDLETLLPEIAAKWDLERNCPLKPSEVTIGSGKRVFWTDREKPVRISDRTKYLRG